MTRSQAEAGRSDIGRRIRQQRIRSGMSVEHAAVAAGMASEYLKYVETCTVPNVSQGTLMRIAAALGVSAAELAGGSPVQRPELEPGGQPVLAEMTSAECRDHLSAGRIGLVVFDEPGHGPVAIPAIYTMDGDDLIIRSTDSSIAANAQHGRVSFDVDHFDDHLASGWSVLLTGTATPVSQADLRRLTGKDIGQVTGIFIRLTGQRLTGRRITGVSRPPAS